MTSSPTPQPPRLAVAYYRVSRKKQAESGLGLEAQEASVRHFISTHNLQLVDQFIEIETGTSRRSRPEVGKAIAAAQRHGATLVIARLDRLARNVVFTAQLQASGIPFICVDMPTANHTTIQLMAVIAEYEARVASQRTREALEAAKNRGVRLGSPTAMLDSVRMQGRAASKENQIQAYQRTFGYISLMRQSGMSLSTIATQLNNEGFRTRNDKLWSGTQVRRVLVLKTEVDQQEKQGNIFSPPRAS